MGTTVYKLTRSFEQSSDHSLATFDLTDITQSSIENVAPIIVDAAEGALFQFFGTFYL